MMHHDASSSRCIMIMHRDDEHPEEVPLENMFNPAVRRRDSCTAPSPHGLGAVHGKTVDTQLDMAIKLRNHYEELSSAMESGVMCL